MKLGYTSFHPTYSLITTELKKMNPFAIQLTLHGAIVMLFGLLSGIPYGSAITNKADESKVHAWKVAHSGLSMGGTTMIAVSAVLFNLKLDNIFSLILVYSMVASGYGFCIALEYGRLSAI